MLSETANKIFKLKYAQKGENWGDACIRVANFVASSEKRYGVSDEEVSGLTKRFFQMIYNLYFLPGGRILANSDTGIKNLMNCFVLPIEDSRQSIYGALKDAAEIFAWGGGIGYNFSNIREAGAKIKTTGGQASGPLSFMSLFDQTGEVIQQASRRGAQMAMMNVDHPDIENFIDFKAVPNSRNLRLMEDYDRNLVKIGSKLKDTKYHAVLRKTLLDDQLTHFNISAVLTDKFMKAVSESNTFDLVSRENGSVVKTVDANVLLDRMADKTWESGDPGLFFLDRANEDNMVPYAGTLSTTNPCGEVPLLPYEACCLGSINLFKFYDEKTNSIDFVSLEEVVRLSVRFLDNIQDVSETPIDIVNNTCRDFRRIGLGVMGLADLLSALEIPYDSEDAKKLDDYLSWFITFFSWQESMELAKTRGAFRKFDPQLVDRTILYKCFENSYIPEGIKFNVEDMIPRNVSVTSVAPTGTIALLAGVNSSIEPFFALAYRRNITEGVGNVAKDTIIEINPLLFSKLKKYGLSEDEIEQVKKHIIKHGNLSNCDIVPQKIKDIFKTSNEIHWKDHIDVQSAWQNFVTNAVSKTINCPNSTTKKEVKEMYIYMWEKNLKGGTIYRDGSKSFQILNAGG